MKDHAMSIILMVEAKLKWRSKEYILSEKLIEKAIELNPNNHEANLHFAQLKIKSNHIFQALDILSHAKKLKLPNIQHQQLESIRRQRLSE